MALWNRTDSPATKFLNGDRWRFEMTAKDQKLQEWIDARKRFNLSHAHIQMARELGLNLRKFDKLVPNNQERWKLPLPQFIEKIYLKHFGRERPVVVMSIEDRIKHTEVKKQAKWAEKLKRKTEIL